VDDAAAADHKFQYILNASTSIATKVPFSTCRPPRARATRCLCEKNRAKCSLDRTYFQI
jgi:hypothetical protein